MAEQSKSDADRAVSKRDAARALSVSIATIERRIADGTLRAVRFGDRVLVPVAELERVLGIGTLAADSSREHILQFFAFEHLPPHLREVSRPFGELAAKIMELPRNPERTVALRKLLEAKDAAVRAMVAK